MRHYWDIYDSRLLVVEAAKLPANSSHIAPETTADSSTTVESTDSDSADDTFRTTGEEDQPHRNNPFGMTENVPESAILGSDKKKMLVMPHCYKQSPHLRGYHVN